MNERCFAYRSERKTDGGYEWKREYCDALTEFLCENKECPFYKPKDKVKKYQYKYGSSYYGVGYEDIR